MSKPLALRAWLLLGAVTAAAGWLLAPDEVPPAALVKARRDAWALPALPRRPIDNATTTAAAVAPYWGVGAVVAPGGAAPAAVEEDPRWRVAAVFGGELKRGALIVFEQASKQPQRLFAGDKLPSGHRIVRITEREVCIQVGTKTYRLGVERREP